MPHDKNGCPIAAGDVVNLTAEIDLIHNDDDKGCNVTYKILCPGDYEPKISCNSKACVKGAPEPVVFGSGEPDGDVREMGSAFGLLAQMPGNVESRGLIDKIIGISPKLSTLLQLARLVKDHWGDITALISALRTLLEKLSPQPAPPAPPAA